MLAASKMKISGSRNRLAGGTEKKKISEQEFKQQLSTYDTFSIKPVTAVEGFHVATTTAKNCTKKVCCTCKVFFLLLIFFGRSRCPDGLELYNLTVEPSLTATSSQRPLFMADHTCIDSCLNLSKTATFFYSQGGRCGEA